MTINELVAGKRVLHLTLKKKWFDEIAAGVKKVEYRENKKYWNSRLDFKSYDVIIFRNGYSDSAPTLIVECRGIQFRHVSEKEGHGARDGMFYCIYLGDILIIARWRDDTKTCSIF